MEQIRDLIRSIVNTSNNSDKKCMKSKFNSNDNLPLKQTLEFYNVIIVVRSFFHKGSNYYLQVFIQMLG